MAGWAIAIAQETDVMGTFGVVMLCCAVVLIVNNFNWLCSMMAWVFAPFQATVAGIIVHLRLFWAEYGELLVIPNPEQPVVVPNPEQQFVIPDDDPINPHSRAEVRYQTELPPLNYWSDSSDNDNDNDNDNEDRFDNDNDNDNDNMDRFEE